MVKSFGSIWTKTNANLLKRLAYRRDFVRAC